jgi:predicted protein tyrosine phosphatase
MNATQTFGLDKIHEHLFISGGFEANEYPVLRNLGITAIVNLIEDYGDTVDPTVAYLHEPISDGEPIPEATLTTIYAFLDEHLPKGKVLVHCGLGLSRSAGIVVGQVVREHPAWTWERAEAHVNVLHPIDVHPEIKKSIEHFLQRQCLFHEMC